MHLDSVFSVSEETKPESRGSHSINTNVEIVRTFGIFCQLSTSFGIVYS